MSDGFRGLQVLIIDAFEDSRAGHVLRQTFFDCVQKCLDDCGVVEPLLINRRVNMLKDYAVDWAFDLMNDETRLCTRNFDKIDLIIAGGDAGVLPWHPLNMQLVSVFNMANKVNKPVFCCGGAAMTYIYSLSTCGLRFNVLNGPLGGLLSDLSSFKDYTMGGGAFPGGYLGNEVGDIYTYDAQQKSWLPKCNIGMHFAGGAAVAGMSKERSCFFSREHRQHPVATPNATVANVRAARQQHYCLKHLEKNFFTFTELPEWIVNNEGGLPAVTSSTLQIIAESYAGPILLAKGNAVLLAALIKDGGSLSYPFSRNICLGWMSDVLGRLKLHSNARIDGNLYDFLFNNVSRSDALAGKVTRDRGPAVSSAPAPGAAGNYETVVEKEFYVCAPALTNKRVKSSLSNGPVLLETPVFSLFFPLVLDNIIDYSALIKQAKNPPIGVNGSSSSSSSSRKIGGGGEKHIVRNPSMQTENRVREILSKVGADKSIKVFQQLQEADARNRGDFAAATPTATGINSPILRDVDKELYAGKVLDDSHVFASKNTKEKGKAGVYSVVDGARLVSPDARIDDVRSIFSEGDDAKAVLGVSRMKLPVSVSLQAHNRGSSAVRAREELGLDPKQANTYVKGRYDPDTGKIVRIKSSGNLHVKFANSQGNNNGGVGVGGVYWGDSSNSNVNNNMNESNSNSRQRPSTAGGAGISSSNLTSKMCQDHYLPIRRPNPGAVIGDENSKLLTSSVGASHQQSVVQVKAVEPHTYFYKNVAQQGPSSKDKYDDDNNKNNNNNCRNNSSRDYEGFWKDGVVYMTPFERECKEEVERKKKILHGTFKTYHGVASLMEVRQEGAVAPQGGFIDPPNAYKYNPRIPSMAPSSNHNSSIRSNNYSNSNSNSASKSSISRPVTASQVQANILGYSRN